MGSINFIDANLNALIVFALFLIIFLLMYIAFWKEDKPTDHKPSK